MAVDLGGNVRMRGDTGPGVGVQVHAEEGRLRLVAGNELVGDWRLSDIGVNSLNDGFNIRAEGAEFVLRTQDDVAFAEEIGVAAASPRLARRLAARHNPEERDFPAEPPELSSNLAAIGFAVAGALAVLGGTFLSLTGPTPAPAAFSDGQSTDFEFWVAFVVGGALMIGVAYVMAIGAWIARFVATIVLTGMVITFGFAVSGSQASASQVTAYGFIAGGLVVGVAVLFSGSLQQPD
ncbi:MAG TPA: hypothetical protein VK969_11855, partial [Acidimicrobiia bacterium]|nr:hypothetical protein [Acidimicrobiia bacterium]